MATSLRVHLFIRAARLMPFPNQSWIWIFPTRTACTLLCRAFSMVGTWWDLGGHGRWWKLAELQTFNVTKWGYILWSRPRTRWELALPLIKTNVHISDGDSGYCTCIFALFSFCLNAFFNTHSSLLPPLWHTPLISPFTHTCKQTQITLWWFTVQSMPKRWRTGEKKQKKKHTGLRL